MSFTCKDCTNRRIGCHSSCEKYLKEKADHNVLMRYINDTEEIYRHTKNEKYKKSNKQLRKYGKSYV